MKLWACFPDTFDEKYFYCLQPRRRSWLTKGEKGREERKKKLIETLCLLCFSAKWTKRITTNCCTFSWMISKLPKIKSTSRWVASELSQGMSISKYLALKLWSRLTWPRTRMFQLMALLNRINQCLSQAVWANMLIYMNRAPYKTRVFRTEALLALSQIKALQTHTTLRRAKMMASRACDLKIGTVE